MANRLLLGTKDSNIGLYISKPGQNVLTDAVNNLLYSSTFDPLQFVQTGRLHLSSGASTTITIPSLGFKPLVLYSGERVVYDSHVNVSFLLAVTYPTSTTVKMECYIGGDFSYVVTRIPVSV